jgi:hypothetical protein
MAYSPHELKKAVLRGFSILTMISGYEKEPEMGIFPLKMETVMF